ncbi:MAG: xanthine dehydrogenase family protein molybdopterin-binding subunit, partial [Solirubrobacteraceae bacterium]
MPNQRLIGAPLARREDARVLRGETRYLDDIDRPGVVHAAFVRSPFAHAAIRSISTPARAEGLVAVVTSADLGPGVRPFPVIEPAGAHVCEAEAHPVLAAGEVRYVGQPVALVIAASRALAEDACELVDVHYEPRPVVTSPRQSDHALMRWTHRSGDVDAVFAAAAHVVKGR